MAKAKVIGSFETPQGLVRLAFLSVGQSPVGIDLGIAGIKVDSLVVFRNGPVSLTFPLVGQAPVREGDREVRPGEPPRLDIPGTGNNSDVGLDVIGIAAAMGVQAARIRMARPAAPIMFTPVSEVLRCPG